MNDDERLRAVESVLARHRGFGDSDYISKRRHVVFARKLDRLADYLPEAAQLASTLAVAPDSRGRVVLSDTVVRCAVLQALAAFEAGARVCLERADCAAILKAADDLLHDGGGQPLGVGMAVVDRLGPEPYHGLVWREDHANDIFGRAFRQLVRHNYGESLCTPTPDELAVLRTGTQLLGELLPDLAASALSHALVIAIFPATGRWRTTGSSSQFRLGGTIFLGRRMLKNPWWVAEHLLHESLHHKLYDFRRGHSLFAPSGTSRSPAPASEICSPWNTYDVNRSNYWDVFRALAAYHVYVQLGLLCRVAERREPELRPRYGPRDAFPPMVDSRRATARAHYLGEQIRTQCWGELGLAGRRLVEWLEEVNTAIDVTPPPPGARLHLLLDLYRKEARTARTALNLALTADQEPDSDLRRTLYELLADEVAATETVLGHIPGENLLPAFKAAVEKLSTTEVGARFHATRMLVSATVLAASKDGYRLGECTTGTRAPDDPDEIMEQMVQRSSQRLSSALAAYR